MTEADRQHWIACGAPRWARSARRMGLSLERIVASAVEIADQDGLAAVSMKRVAERLGFTTMSLYRHVANKDELLLLMQDTCWRPPEGFDIARRRLARGPRDSGRAGRSRSSRATPGSSRSGTSSEPGRPASSCGWSWACGRCRARRSPRAHKIEVLLLLSGYTFSFARLSVTAADGVQRGYFDAGDEAPAFAGLLRQVAGPDTFPALLEAVAGGAFTPDRPFPDLEFDLRVLLDGVDAQVRRAAAGDG